jgi:hypothetical protein
MPIIQTTRQLIRRVTMEPLQNAETLVGKRLPKWMVFRVSWPSSKLIWSFFAVGLICLWITARVSILRAVGHVLIVDEPLRQANLIVVPGWTGDAGAIEAADLIRQGIATEVAVMLNPPDTSVRELVRRGVLGASPADWTVSLLKRLGASSVTLIYCNDGTSAETTCLTAWLGSHDVHSIVVVTLPDHARRLKRLLDRSSRGHGITSIVHVTRYSDFNPDSWWQTRAGLRTGIVESEKLLLDVAMHPFN